MNTDIAHCSGVCCPLKDTCSRYLPDPPDDAMLSWVNPDYDSRSGSCRLHTTRD